MTLPLPVPNDKKLIFLISERLLYYIFCTFAPFLTIFFCQGWRVLAKAQGPALLAHTGHVQQEVRIIQCFFGREWLWLLREKLIGIPQKNLGNYLFWVMFLCWFSYWIENRAFGNTVFGCCKGTFRPDTIGRRVVPLDTSISTLKI